MKIQVVAVLVTALAVASGRFLRQSDSTNAINFVGEGSNSLAINLLQSESKNGENAVFSPLGVNAILAILAEGARGETRNQLAKALNLPEDTSAVRNTYKTLFTSLSEHNVLNQPEFKSWFYVYKNNSIEETYKSVMRDNYLIDIKEVDRNVDTDGEEAEHENSVSSVSVHYEAGDSKETSSEEKKDQDKTEEKKDQDKTEEQKDDKSEESKETSSEEKKDQDKTEEKKDQDKTEEQRDDKSEESKETSSEEKVTDNIAQESETTKKDELTTEMKEDETSTTEYIRIAAEEVSIKESTDDVTTNVPEINDATTTESILNNQVDPKADQSEKVVKERPILEDIIARSLKSQIRSNKEVVSALSANRLASRDALRPNSRMIIFNALYFRGNWSTSMETKKEKIPFHSSEKDLMVEAITGEGELGIGDVPELGATVLELPYQGERYSMIIILPDEVDGLGEVVRKLSEFSIKDVGQRLKKTLVKVCIPKFRFYTISKPKDALLKSGVKDVFGEQADLSGITPAKGIYLDDLVQLVTLDVDESHSSNVQLTIGTVSETRSEPKHFKANHPFLFAIKDRTENLVLVAGLVQNPAANRD